MTKQVSLDMLHEKQQCSSLVCIKHISECISDDFYTFYPSWADKKFLVIIMCYINVQLISITIIIILTKVTEWLSQNLHQFVAKLTQKLEPSVKWLRNLLSLNWKFLLAKILIKPPVGLSAAITAMQLYTHWLD